MTILGINAFHGDSSAALVVDGRLVAAVEEERFNRVKHWAGFPAQSIRFCLASAGLPATGLDHVAVSFNPKANFRKKALFTLLNNPSLKFLLDRAKRQGRSTSLREQLAAATGLPPAALRAQFHHVEHHDAHLASGFFVSPFEEAAILSIDGMGDFVSARLAAGKGHRLTRYSDTNYPHSLGFLYNAFTLYLGFPHYGDEYKVMGLAPYGQPRFAAEIRRVVRLTEDGFELNLDFFTHHKNGIAMSWDDGSPVILPYHAKKLEELLGPARQAKAPLTDHHQDIAASLQVVTEEVIFHLANLLHRRHPSDNLVVVGGCAMNSVANGKFTERTPFKHVFVPAGAADNGTAFGAAFYVWNEVLGQPRGFVQEHGFWGPAPTEEAILAAVARHPVTATRLAEPELIIRTVDTILEGKVVGWFQGRAEFGARALGNRSLIADPRRLDMRDIINLKIKFREKFRPFAPSVLHDHVKDWFEIDAPSPFMEKVFKIKPEKRAQVPAVTHVDGTGRLQTVTPEANPRYRRVIEAFHARTGVPMILNTSLNENEPIVNTPDEGIACFLRTKMDVIVIGDFVIERKQEG